LPHDVSSRYIRRLTARFARLTGRLAAA
jgi:hypothetical protein